MYTDKKVKVSDQQRYTPIHPQNKRQQVQFDEPAEIIEDEQDDFQIKSSKAVHFSPRNTAEHYKKLPELPQVPLEHELLHNHSDVLISPKQCFAVQKSRNADIYFPVVMATWQDSHLNEYISVQLEAPLGVTKKTIHAHIGDDLKTLVISYQAPSIISHPGVLFEFEAFKHVEKNNPKRIALNEAASIQLPKIGFNEEAIYEMILDLPVKVEPHFVDQPVKNSDGSYTSFPGTTLLKFEDGMVLFNVEMKIAGTEPFIRKQETGYFEI